MASVDERFADALHSTARVWRQAVDRRLKHLGVSQASWMTIAVAARAATPLSQSELADALGVEGATMVTMVDRLVKASLIVRVPSATDRRINHVVLTDAGHRLYETVRTAAADVRKELLSGIDAQKLETATEVLEALHRIVEELP
jgi:MarR family transcriptional regulator for hemolysin